MTFEYGWQLPLSKERNPDFLVIGKEQSAALLSVSTTSQETAEALVQGTFGNFLSEEVLSLETFAEAEINSLKRFLQQVEHGIGAATVIPLIVFPNVSQGTLESIATLKPSPYSYLGKQ